LIGIFSTQIYNAPNIKLEVPSVSLFRPQEVQTATFKLTNDGASAATNLTLIIDSPKKIINVTKKFGSADDFLPKLDDQLLEKKLPIRIDKHGEGSLTEVETVTDGKQYATKYRTVVTYDQGTIGKAFPVDFIVLGVSISP
jgi:hypothetical protein